MKNRTYLAITLLLLTGLLFRQAGYVAGSGAAVGGGTVFYVVAGAVLLLFLRRQHQENLPRKELSQPDSEPDLPLEEVDGDEPEERVEQPAGASLGDGEQYFW